MWHVKVTDNGKVLVDQETDVAAVLLVDRDGGVKACSTIEGNGFDTLCLLAGLDSLRERILNDDETVRTAYLLRGDLYKVMEIETGAIETALDSLRGEKGAT